MNDFVLPPSSVASSSTNFQVTRVYAYICMYAHAFTPRGRGASPLLFFKERMGRGRRGGGVLRHGYSHYDTFALSCLNFFSLGGGCSLPEDRRRGRCFIYPPRNRRRKTNLPDKRWLQGHFWEFLWKSLYFFRSSMRNTQYVYSFTHTALLYKQFCFFFFFLFFLCFSWMKIHALFHSPPLPLSFTLQLQTYGHAYMYINPRTHIHKSM